MPRPGVSQVAPAAKKAKGAKDADVSAALGSTTVFIKNLPWAADDDAIYEFFKECGEAVNVRIGKRTPRAAAWQGPCLL